MTSASYTAASGAVAALERLEAATQNLANLGTAGYKAERPVFEIRPLDETSEAVLSTAVQVEVVGIERDFSQGPIRTSGNPLDVAIEGDGFFVVSTPAGERYTRQGTFTLDGEGFLVTSGGHRVQGDGGDLQIGVGEVTIGAGGTIAVDGESRGRLALVSFGDVPALVPEGDALFAPAPGVEAVPLDATAVRLVPRSVEGSNVDPTTALVELVDVSRAFESYMKALQQLDEVTHESIQEVGTVS